MRAIASVHRAFVERVPEIHVKRMGAVFAAVAAILRCGSVIGAQVGRAMATDTTHKHGIKRIDRLLGNPRLHRDLDKLYAVLAGLLLRSEKHPIVLVDWTDLGLNKTVAITAALALNGRAVTVFAQVYSIRQMASQLAHKRFIQGLARVLGPGVCPIIVADAGFHAPFMKLVVSQGWDYICRVRGRMFVGANDGSLAMTAKAFYAQASSKPTDVPNGVLGETKGLFATRLVLADRRSARAKKPPRLRGRRIYTVRAVKRAHEPWLLATSLKLASAERVLSLYGLRMQIEASYRDLKSGRLGWGLEHVRSKNLRRLSVQIALASIAVGVVIVAGLAAEQRGIERHFQANTVRSRRVLSLVNLGRLALGDTRFAPHLTLVSALSELRDIVALLATHEWGDS